MTCAEYERLLDDYVDDELDRASRSDVARHLAACDACRRSYDELRRLGRAVDGLPRELAPGRDLLPGIRRATVSRRSPIYLWAGLAASLVVLSTVAWYLFIPQAMTERETPPGPVAVTAADSGETLSAARINRTEFEMAEHEFQQAAARLLRSLDERKEPLPPETRELIEENLRVIDEAIADVRAALETEPDDPANGHVLNSLYHRKIEFLWRLSRLSS